MLPWIQDAASQDKDAVGHLLDCTRCKASASRDLRRAMGCGYEAPAPASPWMHRGMKGDAPQHCPGYTTKLPEVIEIARARFHWEKGQLDAFCRGELAGDAVLLGIELLAGAVAELSEWRFTPASKGGGGPG